MKSVEVGDNINPDDRAAIKTGIDNDVLAKGIPARKPRPLYVVLRDDKTQLAAGLIGETFWNNLYVDMIWVRPDLQGKGYGRKLIQAAEAEGVKRGCTVFYLWTHDFQAPGFYEKLGYKSSAEFQDFPKGHKRIGFMKQIAA